MKASAYRNIFNNHYNVSFHRAKKDLCASCEKYRNMSHLSEEDKAKREAHISDSKLAQQQKADDREKAGKDFRSVTFDLQSVLSTPCSRVGTMFYARKLNVYNFTTDKKAKREYCYGNNLLATVALVKSPLACSHTFRHYHIM